MRENTLHRSLARQQIASVQFMNLVDTDFYTHTPEHIFIGRDEIASQEIEYVEVTHIITYSIKELKSPSRSGLQAFHTSLSYQGSHYSYKGNHSFAITVNKAIGAITAPPAITATTAIRVIRVAITGIIAIMVITADIAMTTKKMLHPIWPL